MPAETSSLKDTRSFALLGDTTGGSNPVKRFSAAAFLLATSPLLAHSALLAQQTGVSRPQEATADTVEEATAQDRPIPVVTAPAIVVAPAQAVAPTQNTVPATEPTQDTSPAVTLKRRDLAKFDPDDHIVEDVEIRPGELPAGTLLHARLRGSIETATTVPETPFTAELTEPIQHMGRIIVPAGAVLQGRITEIHGGKRIHGAALIHLQAQSIILPDGTHMALNAAVIDTNQYQNTRVDAEGNILRKDHAKETLAALSLTTGSAAAAGGVIGGVPGALVGAGIGAGVGTVWWLKQDRQTQLPADTLLVMSLTTPMPIRPLVQEPEFVQSPRTVTAPVEVVAPPPVTARRYNDSFVPSN